MCAVKQKMTYKDHLAMWTAIASFTLGWLLIIINFFVPPIGVVADSSLWILGQALLYCGGVVGIAQYTKGELKKIKYQVGINDDDGE